MINEIGNTRITLIEKIKDTANNCAWEDFVAVYKSMIINWATYMGCSQSMAEDVFQESIISLLRNLEKFEYNPTKGRFRGYLKTLVTRRVKDAFRRKKMIYENEFSNDDCINNFIENFEDAHEPAEAQLDIMWVTSVVSRALKIAKNKSDLLTYDSFKLYAIDNLPVNEVCRRLSINNEGTVYQQKSRFIKLVTKELENLLEDWGDIVFSKEQTTLNEPDLLKCISEIISNITSIQQTILFQPSTNKLDARVRLACERIVKTPLIDSAECTPSVLNSTVTPNKWISLNSDKCTIGRIPGATINTPANGVSSLHAIIVKHDSEWFIKDEDSTNGTYLNGVKVTDEALIKNGDVIHIAENILIVAGL